MTSEKRPHDLEYTGALPSAEVLSGDSVSSAKPMGLGTQMFRFIISGGISAVVDLGLLALLQLVFGLPVPVARTFSFIAGTTTAYLINRRWTFQAEPSTKRFIAVAILYTVTFGINIGLQTLCDALFTSWGLNAAVAMVGAFIIAQGTGTVINFVVQRTVIFRVK